MMDWLNDPALQQMDPVKKLLFEQAAKQVEGKSGNAMATTMMSLISTANRKGITFSQEEINLILRIMKQGKPAKEQAQIDQMVRMVTTMMQKHKH